MISISGDYARVSLLRFGAWETHHVVKTMFAIECRLVTFSTCCMRHRTCLKVYNGGVSPDRA